VGMFVEGGGWGVGVLPVHTLGLTIGGIAGKPALINGELVLRDCLCVTLSLDHDIVDGAPAARFAQTFKALVESGYGLYSEQTPLQPPVQVSQLLEVKQN